jgi:hypothetical protein
MKNVKSVQKCRLSLGSALHPTPDNLSLDMGDIPNPLDQMNAVSYSQAHFLNHEFI